MVRPRPDALRPQLLTLVDSSCPYGRRRAWSTRRALSPPRGGRNASQVAPRACRARCARLPTRHKQRRAGSRSRTASNLQATHASCASCYAVHEACTNGTPRVLRECRNRAEAVVLMCGLISYTQRIVCYTTVGHAGRRASISPVQSFVREDQQRPYS